MQVVRHITCGYEDTDLNVIQTMSSCGHIRILVCKGCNSATNEYEIVEIDRAPHQPIEKQTGFTKEEVEVLISAAGEAKKIVVDWRGVTRIFIALTMQWPRLPRHTHTAFEKKGDLYDVWYIVPGLNEIRARARGYDTGGYLIVSEETITDLTDA